MMAEVKSPENSSNKKVLIIVVAILVACCLMSACAVGGYLVLFPKITTTVIPTSITETVAPTSGLLRITNFTDTFDSNRGWDVGLIDDDWATSDEYITNGKFHFDATAKKDSVIIRDNLITQAITDVDLSVDGFQVSGAQSADYGLIFRKVDNNNYYLFGVSEGYQEYFLAVQKDDKWTDIIDFTKSQYIHLDSPNNIRVVASGSNFKLYINGTLVKTVTDSTITEGGDVGLAAELYKTGDKGSFEFDNFMVLVND